jgi:hypothetical protein
MIDFLRRQLELFELGLEAKAYRLGISGCDHETEDFIDWLEESGAVPEEENLVQTVLCPSCGTYEANLCGSCQVQADRDAGWDGDCGTSPWRSVAVDGYPPERSDMTEHFVHCIAEGYTTAVYVDMALWEFLEVTHWMPVPPLIDASKKHVDAIDERRSE